MVLPCDYAAPGLLSCGLEIDVFTANQRPGTCRSLLPGTSCIQAHTFVSLFLYAVSRTPVTLRESAPRILMQNLGLSWDAGFVGSHVP